MPRTLAPTIAGCAAVAALVLAAPNPGTAATAGSTAAQRVETDPGMVQQVRYWRRHAYPYGYGYGYGYPSYGYYRPSGYYRPYAYYGGPYGYYGGPYAYYGRPGVSFSFGF